MPSPIVKRVLLYRLGSLGDHLVALPSYRLVRRAFPDATIRLLTNIPVQAKAPAAAAVLEGTGLVQGYLRYMVGTRNLLELAKLWWSIFRWRPEVLVYLAGVRKADVVQRDVWFFRLCGVKRLVGVPISKDMQRRLPLGPCVLGGMETTWFEQEGERLARCIAELGDANIADQANWAPSLADTERAEGTRLLESLNGAPFFAISMGTKAQSNHWGMDRWKALVERMAVEWPNYRLVLLGARDDLPESGMIAAAWANQRKGEEALNLCGACSPRVSAAVMERAAMFLGHDSGPAHMAAAVGTPVLGIFSARNKAGEWVPHGKHVHVLMHWVDCGGCLLETCIQQQKKCIQSITVDEVLSAVKQVLGQGKV